MKYFLIALSSEFTFAELYEDRKAFQKKVKEYIKNGYEVQRYMAIPETNEDHVSFIRYK